MSVMAPANGVRRAGDKNELRPCCRLR
jgi:hypothetical protein